MVVDENRNMKVGITFSTFDLFHAGPVMLLKEAKEHYLKGVQNITYVTSKYDVLNDSNALVLLTEWKEFRSPDFEEIKVQLKTPVIFDGRNQYNDYDLESKGLEYYRIGK